MRSGAGKVAGWSLAGSYHCTACFACFACTVETNPKLSLAVLANRFVFHRRHRSFSKLIDLCGPRACARSTHHGRKNWFSFVTRERDRRTDDRPRRTNCAFAFVALLSPTPCVHRTVYSFEWELDLSRVWVESHSVEGAYSEAKIWLGNDDSSQSDLCQWPKQNCDGFH